MAINYIHFILLHESVLTLAKTKLTSSSWSFLVMRSDSCFMQSADGGSAIWSVLFLWWITASWFFIVILSCSIILVWRKILNISVIIQKNVMISLKRPLKDRCGLGCLFKFAHLLNPYLSFSCRAFCRLCMGLGGRGEETFLDGSRAWSCFSMLIFLSFSCSAMDAIFSISSSAVRRDWFKTGKIRSY